VPAKCGLFYSRNIMPPGKDIPNAILGRFLTLEMLGMVFIIGVSWATITSKVAGLEEQYENSKVTQLEVDKEQGQETKAIRDEVSLINRKMDVMGNNQEHFKQQIDKVDDRLDDILKILEKERAH